MEAPKHHLPGDRLRNGRSVGRGLILKIAASIVALWAYVVPLVSSDGSAAVSGQTAPVLQPPALAGPRAWLIDAGWPDVWLEDALSLVECESHGNPRASNGPHILGLFQLWDGWFRPEELAEWDDPRVNAAVALRVRQTRGRFGGAGGWECADLLGVY